MVPATVGGVAILILLVLPGLHYELLRERRRAGRDDSSFIEISRVLLSGFLLSGAAFCVLGVIRFIGPDIILDPQSLLKEKYYLADHLPLAAWSIAWFITIAFTSGTLTANWPSASSLNSRTESLWITTFWEIPQVNLKPRALARLEIALKNGQAFRGLVCDFSKNLEMTDREIALRAPIERVFSDGRAIPLNSPPWHRIVLPASEITSILVLYETQSGGTTTITTVQSAGRWDKYAPASIRRIFVRVERSLLRAYESRTNPAFLTRLFVAEVCVLVTCGLLSRLL